MAGADGHLAEVRAQADGCAVDLGATDADGELLSEVRQELDRFESLRMIGRLSPSQDARYHELLARESQLLRGLVGTWDEAFSSERG